MVQRFSSREEARQQAIERQRNQPAAYWPKGFRYKTFADIYSLMNRPAATWTYRAPDTTQGTMVVLHAPKDLPREFTVLGKHKGLWYCDFPEPPHLLYQRYEWGNAETIYVCEGERTSDAVEALGLAATTSLGGPTYEKDSDWTPLKGKQVVILADYQLGLSSFPGCRSARGRANGWNLFAPRQETRRFFPNCRNWSTRLRLKCTCPLSRNLPRGCTWNFKRWPRLHRLHSSGCLTRSFLKGG